MLTIILIRLGLQMCYMRADGALRNRPRPDTANGKAFIEDFIHKLPKDERGADLFGKFSVLQPPK